MKIAIHGKKQAGKDTVGDYIVKHYDFLQLALAEPLKMALISIGVPAEQLFEKKDPLYRVLMQVYGEVMRDVDPLYWVKKFQDTVDGIEHDFPDVDVVLTDLRHWNEAEELKDQGYKLVKVICLDDEHHDDHASEIELDDWHDWDAILSAERGYTDSLYDQIDEYISNWERED